MKVLVVTNNYETCEKSCRIRWYNLSDSAVSNTGKPFYLPEEGWKTVAAIAPVIRINRLGKTISPRFADRYFDQIAPAIHFFLPDLYEQLQSEKSPVDMAVSFDKSLMADEFFSLDRIKEEELQLLKNQEIVSVWRLSSLSSSIKDVIASVSKMNTLKIGDFICPGLSEPVDINLGDILELRLGKTSVFKVRIK